MRQGIWWLIGLATLAMIGVGYLFMQWQLSHDAEALVQKYAQMSDEEMMQDANRRAVKLGVGFDIETIPPPQLTAEERWDAAEPTENDQPVGTFDSPAILPAPGARRSGLDPSGTVQGAPVVEADLELRTGLRPGAVKPAMTAEQMAQVRRRQADEAARISANQRWNELLLFIGVLLVLAVFIGVGLYIWLVMGKEPDQAPAPPKLSPRPATPVAAGPAGRPAIGQAPAPPNPSSTPEIAPPMHRAPPLPPPPNLAPAPNLARQPTPASRSPRGPYSRPAHVRSRDEAPQYRSPSPAPHTPRRPMPRLSSSSGDGMPNAGPQYYTPVGVPGTATAPPPTPDPAATPTPAISAPGMYWPDPAATPDVNEREFTPGNSANDVFTPVQMFRTASPPRDKKNNPPKMPWLDDS